MIGGRGVILPATVVYWRGRRTGQLGFRKLSGALDSLSDEGADRCEVRRDDPGSYPGALRWRAALRLLVCATTVNAHLLTPQQIDSPHTSETVTTLGNRHIPSTEIGGPTVFTYFA